MASSINFLSAGLIPNPAAWPQMLGISLNSALGILATSSLLSSDQKYWSVDDGITIALAVIPARAASRFPVVLWIVTYIRVLPRSGSNEQIVGILWDEELGQN